MFSCNYLRFLSLMNTVIPNMITNAAKVTPVEVIIVFVWDDPDLDATKSKIMFGG